MLRDEPDFAREDDDDDDPNDPSHPDHDLSESMPYSMARDSSKPWYTRRWFLLIIAIIVSVGLMLPYLQNIF